MDLGSETKKRYKMYKSKKNWVVTPIVFFGLALGISSNISQVSADTNYSANSAVQTTEIQSDVIVLSKNHKL